MIIQEKIQTDYGVEIGYCGLEEVVVRMVGMGGGGGAVAEGGGRGETEDQALV